MITAVARNVPSGAMQAYCAALRARRLLRSTPSAHALGSNKSRPSGSISDRDGMGERRGGDAANENSR